MATSATSSEKKGTKTVPAPTEPGPPLKLLAADEKELVVPRNIAMMSLSVKNIASDCGDDSPVPLPNIRFDMLKLAMEYCAYHFEHPDPHSEERERDERRLDDISEWDKAFCNLEKLGRDPLFELVTAANYLEIKGLLELVCKTVAIIIKGKTPDEIRKALNIVSDLTPEQEEQIRKENEYKEED